ncbi:MAG: hypothetical protein DRJ66_03825 [Thermoprotei archaeon]|nr:MAG: hypothetical protein DRJ66_03825 [Thermoprotei archaeon]RLF20552.1 MAG: hypothetical protein DRZ82_02050 [Thermoprotei archaeon]
MVKRLCILILALITVTSIILSNYTTSFLERRPVVVLCLSNSYRGHPRHILVTVGDVIVEIYVDRGDIYYAHVIAVIGYYETEIHKWTSLSLYEKSIVSEGGGLISGYRFRRKASDVQWDIIYLNATGTHLLMITPYVMYEIEQYSLIRSKIHMDLHCGIFYYKVMGEE